MDQISLALIQRALGGLSLRYDFLAQNIANANTPDYRPVRVSFEERLTAAAARGREAILRVEPEVSVDNNSDAGPMRLDLELAAAAQTSMRYRALIDLLGRQFALVRAAAAAGR
ncbi:MAG: hypothetical protein ABL889_04275 [Terricaulis sp.]